MTMRTATVLLADLVGSSTQVTTIPQDQAVHYLYDATLPIRQTIENHNGKIMKFTGDGYLAVFDAVSYALRAAEDIRHQFLRQKHTPAGIALDGVRIIINTADVTLQEDDVIGDGVALASRLEKSVPTNEIFVTQAVREIADEAEFSFEEVGDMRPRGWRTPVTVHQLISTETSYADRNVFLLITDMHGLVKRGEPLSASDMIQWMEAWGDLHRQGTSGLSGRVRQFVADMVLSTFTAADDAVQTVLNLYVLADAHNLQRTHLPPIEFKAAIALGDVILSPTGVVGRLVNTTFTLLNATPRGQFTITEDVYRQLAVHQALFERMTVHATNESEEFLAYQLRDTAFTNGHAATTPPEHN